MSIQAIDERRAPIVKSNLKWRMISFFMRTVGRTSRGIDLGYRYGFDSGVMLDKVYENRAEGKYLIGTLIDRIFLEAVGWRAIRARRELLKQILAKQLEEELAAQGDEPARPIVLADVAAGPGRYLLEMCWDLRAMGRDIERELSVICRDLSHEGLQRGEELAESFKLSNFRYEAGDAVDQASLATIEPRPDIVVVSGLYELFTSAATIKKSMDGIYRVLPKGGRLVFTTQVTHPQLDFIANVLVNRNGEPWVMVCRTVSEVEELAERAGFRVVSSQMEPVGLFAVTVCEKVRG